MDEPAKKRLRDEGRPMWEFFGGGRRGWCSYGTPEQHVLEAAWLTGSDRATLGEGRLVVFTREREAAEIDTSAAVQYRVRRRWILSSEHHDESGLAPPRVTSTMRWFDGSKVFMNRLASSGNTIGGAAVDAPHDVVDLTADDQEHDFVTNNPSVGNPLSDGCGGDELSLEDLAAGNGLTSVLVASYGMDREDVLAVFGTPDMVTLVDEYDHVREAPGVEPLVGDGQAFPGWTVVRPKFESGPAYTGGVLHPKLLLLSFADRLRVVVSSANFSRSAFAEVSQCIWVCDCAPSVPIPSDGDLPATNDAAFHDVSRFGNELADFVDRLLDTGDVTKADGREVMSDQLPSSPRGAWRKLLQRHVLKVPPGVHLVASAPGTFSGGFGSLGLAEKLAGAAHWGCPRWAHVWFQCSSCGRMQSKRWLSDFANAIADPRRLPGHPGELRLVWPTERVALSRSVVGRGQYCLDDPDALPAALYQLVAAAHRPPHVLLHSKILFAEVDGAPGHAAWIYAGSHNLSSAAWGSVSEDGGTTRIRSWELGVLLVQSSPAQVALPFELPAAKYRQGDRPWSPSVFNRVVFGAMEDAEAVSRQAITVARVRGPSLRGLADFDVLGGTFAQEESQGIARDGRCTLRLFVDLSDELVTPYVFRSLLGCPAVAATIKELGGIWIADTHLPSTHIEKVLRHLDVAYGINTTPPFLLCRLGIPEYHGCLAQREFESAQLTQFPEPSQIASCLQEFKAVSLAFMACTKDLEHTMNITRLGMEDVARSNARFVCAKYALLIFELENVIIKQTKKIQFLPGVVPFFAAVLSSESVPKIAIATSQSQVGLRLWMQSFAKSAEDKRKAASKPTAEEAQERLEQAVAELQVAAAAAAERSGQDTAPKPPPGCTPAFGGIWRGSEFGEAAFGAAAPCSSGRVPQLHVAVALCSFRYRAKGSGRWGPAPPSHSDDPSWSREWCKPSPGMLRRAVALAGIQPSRALVIGAERSDSEASAAASVAFAWSSDVFGGTLLEES